MSLTTMRRKFKRAERPIWWLLIGIFVLGCFSFFGGYNGTGNSRVQADDLVVAKVNNEEMPRDLYDRAYQINQQRMQMNSPNTPPSPEQEIMMRAAAFDMALNDTLKVQLARNNGASVSDADARAQQKKMIDQVLAGKMNGATATEKSEFEDQVKRAYPLEMIKNELMGQALQKQLEAQTKPTEADLMKSYQEFKVRHILIKADTRSDAEAQRRVKEVQDKIKQGLGFEDLARKYSEDDGSKMKGGDLGWVNQKTGFVPEFREALLKLNKGEVSAPVKSQFGYHLIKADDTRTNLPKDINKPGKKAQYMKEYTDQLVQQKFADMMGKFHASAKIEPVDPFVKGYLTESEMLEAGQKGNQPKANQKLAEAIKAYEQAAGGRYGGPAIYTKLAELYQQAKQDDKAIAALQQALKSRQNPQMAWQLGELLMKGKKNDEAIKAYQIAADGAYDMPWLRPQLSERFRTLKRLDLAAKEDTKWKQWQKANAHGGSRPIQLPNGQTVQMTHEQKTVSPQEAKNLQKPGKASLGTK